MKLKKVYSEYNCIKKIKFLLIDDLFFIFLW